VGVDFYGGGVFMGIGEVIAVTNQKGGVGKTTTTVNLAASLSLGEYKTLVIDFDPQGNASSALGVVQDDKISEYNVYRALIGDCSLKECVRPTELENLFVVPANSDLAGAEIELVSTFAREMKLRSAIATLKNEYDFILIDSPPSLGLLTVNALTSADSYLVPLQTEYFALEGLTQLLTTVGLLKQALNPGLQQEGIVLTMFDGRNKLANEVEKEVRTHFASAVFKSVIPRNVRLSECSSFGKPILLYDIDSKGCVAYFNLAKEIIDNNIKNNQKSQERFAEL
jgi:chromosome partitioning protein